MNRRLTLAAAIAVVLASVSLSPVTGGGWFWAGACAVVVTGIPGMLSRLGAMRAAAATALVALANPARIPTGPALLHKPPSRAIRTLATRARGGPPTPSKSVPPRGPQRSGLVRPDQLSATPKSARITCHLPSLPACIAAARLGFGRSELSWVRRSRLNTGAVGDRSVAAVLACLQPWQG